jgi:hypothetical protein
MNRLTRLSVSFALISAIAATGCGSAYTIVDRSALTVSDNARLAAENMLPGSAKNPRAAAHFALAQEVYQRQLDLLKERRNKVRARRRVLQITSFGLLAVAAGVAGSVAMGSDDPGLRRGAGAAGLAGVGLGTGLQIGALMQEEVGAVDDKIRHLQEIYDAMVERVRVLAAQPASEQNDTAIAVAIESFINQALQINVKG